LIGENVEELGPRFADMSASYDKALIKKARSIADAKGYRCHIGVYAAVSGPTFETRAEYKYIRTIGADAVGMSTVPEVITARHMNIPCFALSIITDLGATEIPQEVSHAEVLLVATAAEKKMTTIIRKLIESL